MDYNVFYVLALTFVPVGVFIVINMMIRYIFIEQDDTAKNILYFCCNMAAVYLGYVSKWLISGTLIFFIILTAYVSFKRSGKENEFVDFMKSLNKEPEPETKQ